MTILKNILNGPNKDCVVKLTQKSVLSVKVSAIDKTKVLINSIIAENEIIAISSINVWKRLRKNTRYKIIKIPISPNPDVVKSK